MLWKKNSAFPPLPLLSLLPPLALALPLLRGKGVCTAVITCDRNNLASASTILRCKGIEAGEILDPDTGGINRIFKICLSDG